MSATDPVAVISLFKSLGTEKKISILIEGESLLNDGSAVVTLEIILVILVPMVAKSTSGENGHSTMDLFMDGAILALGGPLLGIVGA